VPSGFLSNSVKIFVSSFLTATSVVVDKNSCTFILAEFSFSAPLVVEL
jgi:hypothetical protein